MNPNVFSPPTNVSLLVSAFSFPFSDPVTDSSLWTLPLFAVWPSLNRRTDIPLYASDSSTPPRFVVPRLSVTDAAPVDARDERVVSSGGRRTAVAVGERDPEGDEDTEGGVKDTETWLRRVFGVYCGAVCMAWGVDTNSPRAETMAAVAPVVGVACEVAVDLVRSRCIAAEAGDETGMGEDEDREVLLQFWDADEEKEDVFDKEEGKREEDCKGDFAWAAESAGAACGGMRADLVSAAKAFSSTRLCDTECVGSSNVPTP